MALSDVMKKREVTNEAKEKKQFSAAKIFDDVRIVIAIIAIACIALVALIVYNNGKIEETRTRIDTVKAQIVENQNKIANLKALQARSGEYIAQKEAYDKMISDEELDNLEIMIAMEQDVEAHNCNLTDIAFSEISNNGFVNEMTVNIRITGSFRDIMSFCRDTISGTTIKRIDTIRMTGGTNQTKTAEIAIVLFSK